MTLYDINKFYIVFKNNNLKDDEIKILVDHYKYKNELLNVEQYKRIEHKSPLQEENDKSNDNNINKENSEEYIKKLKEIYQENRDKENELEKAPDLSIDQKKVLDDMVKYGYISDIKKNEIIGQSETYRKYFEDKNLISIQAKHR